MLNKQNNNNKEGIYSNDEFLCITSYLSLHSVPAVEINLSFSLCSEYVLYEKRDKGEAKDDRVEATN